MVSASRIGHSLLCLKLLSYLADDPQVADLNCMILPVLSSQRYLLMEVEKKTCLQCKLSYEVKNCKTEMEPNLYDLSVNRIYERMSTCLLLTTSRARVDCAKKRFSLSEPLKAPISSERLVEVAAKKSN